MTQKLFVSYKQAVMFAFLVIAAVIALFMLAPQPTQAQQGACSNLPSDKGLAVHNASDVGSGTYTVFARVKVASGNATFDLSIDGAGGSLCNQQISKSGSNGNWVWVKHGSTINWSGGDMKIQMSGDKDGVGLDCVVLHTDANFNPTTKEDCAPVSSDGSDGSDGPTGCEAYDVNSTNSVTITDVLIVYSNIGTSNSGDIALYDMNSSNSVTITDVLIVYSNIGCTP